jgi:hypothetical protein
MHAMVSSTGRAFESAIGTLDRKEVLSIDRLGSMGDRRCRVKPAAVKEHATTEAKDRSQLTRHLRILRITKRPSDKH